MSLDALDPGPLADLPRLSRRRARLEQRLARASSTPVAWLGMGLLVGPVEVIERASGLRRPGLVAQLSWPSLATRLALGIETPVAHALVDRLLGFTRLTEASRVQITPVEWGVLTFALARTLEQLPIGPTDLTIDRVGPDPFDLTGLGPIVTLRWSSDVGPVRGSIRLWLPETLVEALAGGPASGRSRYVPVQAGMVGRLAGPRGDNHPPARPRGLRAGGVLPLADSALSGGPKDLRGAVTLELPLSGRDGRFWFPAQPAAYSGGGRLTLTGPMQHDSTPREPLAVNPVPPSDPAPAPPDVPVTLVVELGRVNLSLGRLADLKPGDVVELGRHSREPIELTSGGRLIARGELVQIDTELGVRVTQVFL